MPRRDRLTQIVLIGGTLALGWLAMLACHELGHVLGAWLTGGRVTDVVLHPFSISRTDVQPNPSPAVVVWAGPLLGIALPAIFWAITRILRLKFEYLLRFWTGFCLVANGAYIGSGVLVPVGDSQTMLQTGTPAWLLGLFAAATLPSGFWCWHGQGRYFGLGSRAAPVSRRHAIATVTLVAAIVIAEIYLAK